MRHQRSWIAGLACAVLLPLASLGSAAPVRLQGAFERGVDAYRRGDYVEARERWQESLAQVSAPLDRARVYFDLGNAHWRLEKPLEAIACYTAAVRLDPRHGEAWKNLELARAQASLPPADAGDLRATLVRALTSLRPGEARWLALGGLLAWLGLLAFEIRLGGATLRGFLVLGAGCALLAAAPWLHGLLRPAQPALMVVVQPDGVSLRGEPLEARDPIGALAPLAEVQRIDELPGWVRVELPAGLRGWVRSEALFAIELTPQSAEPRGG